jgi:hypothetical protein
MLIHGQGMTKKTKLLPVTVPAPLPANIPVVIEGKSFTPVRLAMLAGEVAMDMKELPDILKAYNLTAEVYEKVCEIPFYANALETARLEWNSPLGTHARIRIESAAILEEALPGLSARMKSRDEAFPAAIEAGKLFAKIAGLGEPEKAGASSGEKFTINIDLGQDKKLTYEKDVTPIVPVIEQEPET